MRLAIELSSANEAWLKECMQIFVDRRADLNAKSEVSVFFSPNNLNNLSFILQNGWTALHLVVTRGRMEAVNCLLDARVDATVLDSVN